MFLINPYILQASGNPLWDGLQAYYTADNTPNDALGNYNGTLVNGATYGTGIINNGFSLDGVNDYITTNKALNLNGGTPFSVNFWLKSNAYLTANSLQNVFGTIRDDSNVYNLTKGFQFYMYGNGGSANRLSFLISNNNSGVSSYAWVHILANVVPNTWYNVTMTYNGNGDTSGINTYINNSASKTVYINNLQSPYDTITDSPTIGANIRTDLLVNRFLNGLVDEVGVWNRELTSSEITELYNSGSGKQYT